VRIAVSGTHCSGKSTLIEDFLAAHRNYAHEPEPYEMLELYGEASAEEPDAESFYRQLELSVERLRRYPPGSRVIAERSPLDFIAYLLTLGDRELVEPAMELAAGGMEHIDLLVVLPLNDADGIEAPESEYPELREAMNERLLELIATGEFNVEVIELYGDPRERLAVLESRLVR